MTVRTREGRYASASGRVELSGELRIARIGDLLVNVVPHGVLVVIENLDLPGMIGKVGTLFGAHRVNIADMRVGRKAKGESAIMVLTLDGAADGPVLEELSRLEGVTRATLVKL